MPSLTNISTVTAASHKWELAVRSHGLWEALAESVRAEGLDPLQTLGWMKTETFFGGIDSIQLLAMIGEQFHHRDQICRAVVNVSIGKQWKELLNYNDNIGLIFHVEHIILLQHVSIGAEAPIVRVLHQAMSPESYILANQWNGNTLACEETPKVVNKGEECIIWLKDTTMVNSILGRFLKRESHIQWNP
ncbi:uncharacterized protein LOC127242105 [Andrographis paniculata]|uniref:uncharacterized protein LOC127242105 n=1 Tax=Andrographis paniculata TaxID=175694 RepID=UPI0021E84B1C|nr:uncharacterized protein LOC127242105 [Andrographis paniculata]XP_051117431.1 uncharacterized protein LOC127242105 [Andrographis paniculata]XP_051117432.1 uncharacterized protein LOC127242105 [Andrographis paniculata]